ncbi:MAG: TIGR03619 family F420-dependent LLM class oxidoreductase [Halobacteriaceae archaeon]
MTDLDFGVILPQWSDEATAEGFERVARAADRAGLDAVWGGDHVVFPADEAIPDSAADWARVDSPTYDVFAVMGMLAGVTEDVRLATNICVAPLRHPAHLAKLALSLSALSGGRFDLGVAVGWLDAEFDLLDVPFEERGPRTDEFLAFFGEVLAEPELSFEGPFHSIGPSGYYPRPENLGVWVGGTAGASVRRTAEYGDGWTIGNYAPADLADERERLDRAWADFGRDGDPDLAHTHDAYVGADPPDWESPLAGAPGEVADGVAAYAEAGATQVNLRQRGLPVGERVEQIERFADEVIPRL